MQIYVCHIGAGCRNAMIKACSASIRPFVFALLDSHIRFCSKELLRPSDIPREVQNYVFKQKSCIGNGCTIDSQRSSCRRVHLTSRKKLGGDAGGCQGVDFSLKRTKQQEEWQWKLKKWSENIKVLWYQQIVPTLGRKMLQNFFNRTLRNGLLKPLLFLGPFGDGGRFPLQLLETPGIFKRMMSCC